MRNVTELRFRDRNASPPPFTGGLQPNVLEKLDSPSLQVAISCNLALSSSLKHETEKIEGNRRSNDATKFSNEQSLKWFGDDSWKTRSNPEIESTIHEEIFRMLVVNLILESSKL